MRALALLAALLTGPSGAQTVQVAVAANFAGTAKDLAGRFGRDSGHKVLLSPGSTGKLYAQIRSGAPFEVFLSADDATPARLENERLAVTGSRFTYAIGRLVLWSPQAGFVDDRGEVLRRGAFKRLAIANPRLAPYGLAARQAMQKLGAWESVQAKLVQGENIAQTLQFVSSGNAELGFVALAQVQSGGKIGAGSAWRVPAALHEPLRQDAVLLSRGEGNAAAAAFLAFLRTPAARAVIADAGYELP